MANQKDKVKELTEQLDQGVKELFESERWAEYLSAMSKFHAYSFNNVLLIILQKPEATRVAGYQTWKKLGRQVRKGEKSISIIAPCPHKYKKEVKNEDGTADDVEGVYNTYRAVPVFDISQTDGKDLPDLVHPLEGTVSDFDTLFNKLVGLAPCPITIEGISGGANGYFDPTANRIVVKKGMSETQTIKTTVHEITHSILHGKSGICKDVDNQTKEVQAESVAYVVCCALGIDTSDYSFGYIAGWSSGKERKELNASMDVIQKTANGLLLHLEKN